MKRIFIQVNSHKEGAHEAALQAQKQLAGKAEVAEISLREKVSLPQGEIDLVISLGGDGSFLQLVPEVALRGIPMMGINMGKMGFHTAGLLEDMSGLLDDYLEDRMEIKELMLLDVTLVKKTGRLRAIGLNDTVIGSADLSRILTLKAAISSESLFTIRSDGLVISSPTGSTAHSLSAGGTIIDPRMDALQITPLNPQSLSSRPIVVHPSEEVEVELLDSGIGPEVFVDGRRLAKVEVGEPLLVSRHAERLRVLQPASYRFFHRLREKLGWSRNPV
ncbi:MAG: NAD(+)/NADH kinase [Planctomycetes bacterium]|nr:NAD(+)/NADH kinase [Planctomycetota bacterium]